LRSCAAGISLEFVAGRMAAALPSKPHYHDHFQKKNATRANPHNQGAFA